MQESQMPLIDRRIQGRRSRERRTRVSNVPIRDQRIISRRVDTERRSANNEIYIEPRGLAAQLIRESYIFILHVTVASIIFSVIAGIAILLGNWLYYLELKNTPPLPVVYALEGGKYFLLIVDIALFMVFVLRSAINFGKLLWKR